VLWRHDRTRRRQAALIALAAEDALIVEAQAEVERYLAKEFEAAELVNRIVRLFDGPDQRRAQQLAREALTEG
jgi:hypothetical protein